MILLRIVMLLSLAGLVAAQTEQGQAAGAQTDEANSQPSYGGPSVLSRGLLPSVRGGRPDIEFNPYIGVNAVCDSGLTAVSLNANGRLPNVFQCGVEATAGLMGSHSWKRTSIGLSYNGTYRHYLRNNFYDGTDQTLAFLLTHQLSKHVTFRLREAAGTFSRGYGFGPGTEFFDPFSLQLPTASPFDNRVIYGSTGADLTFVKSARWSFNVGGEGDLVRRRSSALYGLTAGSARADATYRYSRFGTVGVSYQFIQYSFTKAFGTSDVHIADFQYALRLSRAWEFAFAAGFARVESLSVGAIAVDPVIAAITGQTTSLAALYRLTYIPDINATLTRGFRHGSLDFRYQRGVSPGNGIYLTSGQESGGVSYSYNGLQHWSFAANAIYMRLSGVFRTTTEYRSYQAGLSATRTLGAGFQLNAVMQDQRYDTGFGGFRRNAYRASLGFAWSPGNVPITFW